MLSNTSPERRADTRSSNSPPSSSSSTMAFLTLCSRSFLICRQKHGDQVHRRCSGWLQRTSLCVVLTWTSMSARFSSSSRRRTMSSLSCRASENIVRKVLKMPKKSSGCGLDASSPKCLSAFKNFSGEPGMSRKKQPESKEKHKRRTFDWDGSNSGCLGGKGEGEKNWIEREASQEAHLDRPG